MSTNNNVPADEIIAQSAPPAESSSLPSAAADARPGISPDAIARLAFEFYLARGGAEGSDLDDWLRAEAELRLQAPSDSPA
jgi:hypothetical protein